MKTDSMGQLHRAAARCFQSRDAEWVPHLCRGGGHEWSANSRQRGADFSPRRLKSAARLPIMAGGVSEAARRAPHDAIHHALHDRAAEHARIRCFGAFTSAYLVRLCHLSASHRNRSSKRRPAPTGAPFCNDSISGVSKCKVPLNDRHRRDPMGGGAGSLEGPQWSSHRVARPLPHGSDGDRRASSPLPPQTAILAGAARLGQTDASHRRA